MAIRMKVEDGEVVADFTDVDLATLTRPQARKFVYDALYAATGDADYAREHAEIIANFADAQRRS